MASLHRLLILTLLGAARAPPPGSSDDSGDACAADGSSASYSETISTAQGVTKRTIVSAGCPNHESYCTGKPANKPTCDEEGLKGSGTEATDQDLDVDVPANPKLLDADDWAAVLADAATVPAATATEGDTSSLDCEMGGIAYALNGVVFYSGAVGNKLNDPPCPQLDIYDDTAEWISFDCCSGHSSGTGGYHYHFPPSCLIAQANSDAPISDGHSSQIGWAQDGFPICPRPCPLTPSTRLVIHRPFPRRRPAWTRRRRNSQLRRLGRASDLLPGQVRRLRGRARGRRQLQVSVLHHRQSKRPELAAVLPQTRRS